ncbi:hypothetical protein BV22DRAFT_100473 [Leucogyrophana mollusca]|uniref:Uncharacterized protein n=1 Tax=Leucogyrophana mollusca TaxID=85980 RepID=A0ACB8BWD3_9AGAM|nr:hypothetical protein BV22DRAFT_100473 [Leucogyrophana mollusca]
MHVYTCLCACTASDFGRCCLGHCSNRKSCVALLFSWSTLTMRARDDSGNCVIPRAPDMISSTKVDLIVAVPRSNNAKTRRHRHGRDCTSYEDREQSSNMYKLLRGCILPTTRIWGPLWYNWTTPQSAHKPVHRGEAPWHQLLIECSLGSATCPQYSQWAAKPSSASCPQETQCNLNSCCRRQRCPPRRYTKW